MLSGSISIFFVFSFAKSSSCLESGTLHGTKNRTEAQLEFRKLQLSLYVRMYGSDQKDLCVRNPIVTPQ